MIIEKCQECDGMKNILGMGGIKIKCHKCDGKGYIEKQKENKKHKSQEKH
jgi:DnaJ-class molecular chaperone